LIVALAVFGCGDGANGPGGMNSPDDPAQASDPGVVVDHGIARMTSALSRRVPELPATQLSDLVADNSTFALDLYRELSLEAAGDNFFYAPYSISTAMAMAYVGARSTTRDAIADALRFELPDDVLHQGFNALARELDARQRPAQEDVPALALRTANDIWASELPDERPLQSYVDALALDYASKVNLVNFGDEPAARGAINGEVSRLTEGTIPELLQPGHIIPGVTTMILTNAVYFKAGWATPFEAASTRPAPFHNLDGSEGEVEMMATLSSYEYADTAAAQALRLPYVGNEVALLVLLPKGDFASFESTLDSAALGELRAQLQRRSVQVGLPTFSMRSSLELKETLKSLGMYAGFDDQGVYDFSGIGPSQEFITAVVHQAFVAVDEAGTEAGAATAVIFGEESAAVVEAEFVADRPFIMLLEDVPTGTLLFAGRYVKVE
jgi:serpin B